MAYEDGGWFVETTIPYIFLTDEVQYVQAGTGGLIVYYYVSKTSILLSRIINNGNDVTSYSMHVYAR